MILPKRSEFIEKIDSLLKQVVNECEKGEIGESNKEWTDPILKGMEEIAGEYKLEFSSAVTRYEYLYDGLFWQTGSPTGVFSCVEIEWGADTEHDADGYDFQKILVCRAEVPIFITEKANPKRFIDDKLKQAKGFIGSPKPVIFVLDKNHWDWQCSE